ncbi:hypothetical protein BU25DRAFT_408967 [Macroventuria anomochaeta]|uniref:Uncharacterized protein n=1 Tax=Macroventuria anomochaeta TaxID=301207 RepID=A0ACB6S7Z6_9PLEO|nr:uncharacterized protein BU25DRAFT_408967 [Macroventuria anomochaeta]KAF2629695.1 hypothetical protein BU25DRAFT_408967 [Macroventuria anomochaeta]
MRNLAELMKLMQAGVIDVDPEYQRDVVWTADRMTGLINSLMENFYVPPIILNKKPRPGQDAAAPQETLVCVDGKQRLSSVLAFVKGMIPCHDHRGEKWWFCEPAGSKRKRVLSKQLQKQFYQKDFVSFEYNNLSPEQEEDLFARVQMGVQLNLAEKMRASTGPWQELARLFVADFPVVYSLMKDKARSKDFQLTLSCFSQIIECMHPTAANGVPILKTNHTHLPKLLSNKSAVDDGLKSHLASVWNTFKDLIEADPDTFTNGNKYLRGVQTFAPVEMVAVTVLISMYSEIRNNRLLLGDIQAMRIAVRENFVDLRLNASVWKWFWEYIDELEAIRGAIDGSTVNRRTKQRTKMSDKAPTEGATAGSTAAAITAAAAAPKKGRFTARTKRPATTIAEEAPVMVEQELATAASPEPRSPKRRRTGDSPLNGLPMSDGQFWGSLPSTTVPPNGLPEERIRPEPMHPDPLLPPMPTHASTQSPQPVARKPRPRAYPAISALPSTASLPRNASSSIDSAQSHVHAPTPSEARQQRVSTLNSFQSAHQSSARAISTGLPVSHEHHMGQPRAPVAPMVSGLGPFSPDHSHSQWGGVLESTPETDVAPQVSASSRPRSMQKARTSPPQPAQEHYDGAIDLTSDTEQERQDLLSAFKTKSGSSGSPKAPKSAAEPVAQTRTSTAKEQRVSSQDLPTRENNPYARFKNI